jgi:hypothetical protein
MKRVCGPNARLVVRERPKVSQGDFRLGHLLDDVNPAR